VSLGYSVSNGCHFLSGEIELQCMQRIALTACAFAVLAIVAKAPAQAAPTPAPGSPAQQPQATAAQPAAVQAKAPPAGADAWKKAHDEQLLTDFPWLARFKHEDAQLPPPAPAEDRVVFMGDSITEGWHLDTSFPGKPYINRGISGQTSPQMLLRFRQDVIDLEPKVVVILAGTNDVAGNTGPMTLGETEDNLASMADLATMHRVRVVLCSVTPAFDFPWAPGLQPAPKIDELNEWIKNYASEKGYVFVDYHTALKDARDGLPAALSHDGVHPNPAGYAIMAPLAEAGIEKALAQTGWPSFAQN
jgi:acyl-CoA thioesterase I